MLNQLILFTAALALVGLPATAQDQLGKGPRTGDPEEMRPRAGDGFKGRRGGPSGPGGPGSSGGSGGYGMGNNVERYLKHLEEKDPAAFQELNGLRVSDPEAFRRQLMGRLQEMRRGMEKLPPEQREEIRRKMMERRGGDGPGGQFRPHGGGGPSREKIEQKRKQFEAFKQEVDGLRQRYTQSEDDAVRSQIRSTLKEKIGAMFDARQAERREHINRFRAELEAMEKRMAEDDAKRDKHVQHRLDEMLQP